MSIVTDPIPGERRLDRPPSDRYLATDPTPAPDASPTGSPGPAIVAGVGAALIGALATIVLGGVLSVSAGLLVIAAASGWAIGRAVRGGGGVVRPTTRPLLAALVALLGVVIGQLGLWWYAGLEGGVLAPLDYLAQTFGILVPAQAAMAIGLAWWTAR